MSYNYFARPLTTTLLAAVLAALLSACLYEPIHQGNRIDPNEAYMIQEGDTKFRVEQALGTPVLTDVMHPDRASYVEQYEDEESGDIKTRSIIITYDKALRVKHIQRSGFEVEK